MDAHGDELTLWTTDGSTVQRTEAEWALIAGYVRHAATKLGPDLPMCLPGEPQQCGRSAQQHVLAWSAELKARAHRLIETSAPSVHTAAAFAGPLYKDRLAALRDA